MESGLESRKGEVFITPQEVVCGLFPADFLHGHCKVLAVQPGAVLCCVTQVCVTVLPEP